MYRLKGDQTGLLEPIAVLLRNSRKSISRQIGREFRKEVPVLVVEDGSDDMLLSLQRRQNFLRIILVGEGQRRRAIGRDHLRKHGEISSGGLPKGQILVSKKCS